MSTSSLSFEQANLVSNNADKGGAVYAIGSTSEMQSLVFSNNSSEQGGALWFNRDASALIGLDISSSSGARRRAIY